MFIWFYDLIINNITRDFITVGNDNEDFEFFQITQMCNTTVSEKEHQSTIKQLP